MKTTAKNFVDDVYAFFNSLSDNLVEHRNCKYERWRGLNLKCVSYKKKYVIAFRSLEDRIEIYDFVSFKMLYE